jgi:hypothetical protein
MATPDIIFDVLLFGALFVAALADRVMPSLSNGVLLVVTGVCTYLSAIDLSDWLRHKGIRTNESLMTSLSVAVLGVVYYTTHWRAHQFTPTSENLALVVLSIVLMMTALMAAISVLAMISEWQFSVLEWTLLALWCGATAGVCFVIWRANGLTAQIGYLSALSALALVVAACLSDAKRAHTVLGLLVTALGACALGFAASHIVLMEMPPQKPMLLFVLLIAAFIVGKAWLSRHLSPALQPQIASDELQPHVVSADAKSPSDPPKTPQHPMRGMVLPRFAAVVMLAPVIFYLFKGG